MSSKGGDEQSANFKYQYHPGGDPNAQPKDAPSALHSVIVPNVNLPKVGAAPRLHWEHRLDDRFYSHCTRSTTSGGRMGIELFAWSLRNLPIVVIAC